MEGFSGILGYGKRCQIVHPRIGDKPHNHGQYQFTDRRQSGTEQINDNNMPVFLIIREGGPVIKYSASQRYATTAFTAAYFMEACERAGVAFQQFVNRNDIPGSCLSL